MTIYGHYKPEPPETPSAYVRIHVSFPRFSVRGWVDFLVDSGATGVIIHSADVRKLRIPRDLLRTSPVRISRGIGGIQRYYSEPGTLSFETESLHLRCHLDLHIAGDADNPARIPSLLGREFLNRCDLRLNHPQNLVALTPLNVDAGGIILPP